MSEATEEEAPSRFRLIGRTVLALREACALAKRAGLTIEDVKTLVDVEFSANDEETSSSRSSSKGGA